MSTSPSSGHCPACGAVLPPNAPQGLCPSCLLRGVAAPTESGSAAKQPASVPSIEDLRAAFPQLEILELIGRGGMGAVFKARQTKLNRLVALKILPQSLARDLAFPERLAREGQLLARLSHPNIVTVHDFGEAQGYFYLLMEYVDGVNLRQAMRAGRFSPEEALTIIPMICEALQYAHDEGVLHRDIKPENILLDAKGRVKLVDFGIAKIADTHEVSAEMSEGEGALPQASDLTQSGSALGTPHYMAPEQRTNPSTVDQRADIYSLGVVLYEMLTGEMPSGRFAPPSKRTPVDPRVDELVRRTLARRKEERFRSATDVKTWVETINATGCRAPRRERKVPEAARGSPLDVSRRYKNAILTALVVLFGFRLWPNIPWRRWFQLQWGLFQTSLGEIRIGWVPSAVAMVGILAVAWLGLCVWRRRYWLIAPLWTQPTFDGSPPADLASRSADDSRDHWLSVAWTAVLALVACQLALSLLNDVVWLVQQSVQPSIRGMAFGLLYLIIPGMTLLPPGVWLLLLVLLIRRELRQTEVVSLAPAPAWMPRTIVLGLTFAIVTSIPYPGWAFSPVSLSVGGLVVAFPLALWTRSRLWRAIALAVLIGFLIVGTMALLFELGLYAWLKSPGNLSKTYFYLRTIWWSTGLGLLGIFCSSVGLAVLVSPRTREVFGLKPRSHPRSQPEPVASPA